MLEEKTFNTGAVALNYAEGPRNGPPLLLLHGVINRWQVFLQLIPVLQQRWHILAPDLRGHGKSGRAPGHYSGEEYSADIVALLKSQIGEPAVIFGHSLGGMVAMWIAAHCPQLVRALILADNIITLDVLQDARYSLLFRSCFELMLAGRSVEDMTAVLGDIRIDLPGQGRVRVGDLPGNDPAYLRWLAFTLKQADPGTLRMVLDGSAIGQWDGAGLLRRITCPTLLLQGNPALGALMTDADVELAKSVLPCVVHLRFAGLGHPLYIHEAWPIARAVMNFLETL